jgi:ABC-type bacteriocin/lantibiotic exporter with double-glycine peptidase domain
VRVLLVSLLVLGGCASTRSLIPIHSYQQEKDHTCGQAATRTLLELWKLPVPSEAELEREMGSTEKCGTSFAAMVEALRKRGLVVKHGTDGTLELLRRSIAEGIPVVVQWIDWGGHWVVVVGYDTKGTAAGDDDELWLADPWDRVDGERDGLTVFNAERFDSMWFGEMCLNNGKPVPRMYLQARRPR